MSSRFQSIEENTTYDAGFFAVSSARFRHEDGEEVERQIVRHTGAVGIIVLDDDRLWFVRQPREAIGSPDLLELPAGKLDEEGEDPLDTAKRELAEEIGKRASGWEPLGSFYTSPGFTDEEVHLFLATGISDVGTRPEVDHDERIDVEVRRLTDLDAILAETNDSKTLIGLYKLKDRLSRRS